MKPTIFLDIDGVINPSIPLDIFDDIENLNETLSIELHDTHLKEMNNRLVNHVYHYFSKECCTLILKLVQEFDCQIVITSSWRIGASLEDLQSLLNIFQLGSYIIGKTGTDGKRIDQINAYKKEHSIQKYIVIDDLNMKSEFGYRMIRTKHFFSKMNYFQARNALGIQSLIQKK